MGNATFELPSPDPSAQKRQSTCDFCACDKEQLTGSLMVQMKGRFRTSCFQQHKVSDWHLERVYSPGACVSDRENPALGFSVCMMEHASSPETRPMGFPFRGLMVETFREITECLALGGVLDSTVVTLVHAYVPCSDVWWPLCKQGRGKGLPEPYMGCGNVCTLEGEACQLCQPCPSPTLYLASLRIEQNPDPKLLEEAVALLQRSFHADVATLITKGAARASFDKINLAGCRTWCVMHPQRGLVGALMWRCVCTNGEGGFGVRMLEVLFLATREDMAQTKVAEEVVDRLLTFARVENFDVISVAAVPAQGVTFWKKNGLFYYPDPSLNAPAKSFKEITDNLDVSRDVAKVKQLCSFLHTNMLVFPDTPLFARVL
jgi:hypothetical protein